jgi:hypothetical protein
MRGFAGFGESLLRACGGFPLHGDLLILSARGRLGCLGWGTFPVFQWWSGGSICGLSSLPGRGGSGRFPDSSVDCSVGWGFAVDVS